MPSTFANRDCQWYIRTDGNELNGGGFDPYVSGAGTNYADQASPQWSSTTGTVALASPTVLVDASMTFDASIVGNVLRASARTGGSAIALDYFVVTGYTDSHTITLDRAICATADITALTYRIGGAFAHIKSLSTSSNSGTNNPALAGPLIGGNDVWIRGSGSDDPAVNDYDWGNDYWNFVSGGNLSNGNLRFHGYNGRPRVNHRGLIFWSCGYSYIEHCSFYHGTTAHTTHGIFSGNTGISQAGGTTAYYDCIFDAGGRDSRQCWFGNSANGAGHVIGCEFRNTGGGAAGTNGAIRVLHGGCLMYGMRIHAQRGYGVAFTGCYGGIHASLIHDCLGDGVKDDETDVSAPIPLMVANTTIDANGGHGINLSANAIANIAIFNNIISNHVAASKYAINFADTRWVNEQKYKFLIGYNCYYGNTNGKFNQSGGVDVWTINPSSDGAYVGDLEVDPGYADAAGNDFRIGANVRNMGIIMPPNLPTAAVIDMGGVRG